MLLFCPKCRDVGCAVQRWVTVGRKKRATPMREFRRRTEPRDYIDAIPIRSRDGTAREGTTLDFRAIDVTEVGVYAFANEVLN